MSPDEIAALVEAADHTGVATAILALDIAGLRSLDKRLSAYGARPWAEDVLADPWDRKWMVEHHAAHQRAIQRRAALGIARLVTATSLTKAQAAWRLAHPIDLGTDRRAIDAALHTVMTTIRPSWAGRFVESWPRADQTLRAEVTIRWAAAEVCELPQAAYDLEWFLDRLSDWTPDLAPTLVEAHLIALRVDADLASRMRLTERVRRGLLPRIPVIAGLVVALINEHGTRSTDTRLMDLLEEIAPTAEEWRACAPADLAILLGHRAPRVVSYAERQVALLDDVAMLGRAMPRAAGALVGLGKATALELIGFATDALEHHGSLAEEVAEVLAAGFAHPRPDVAAHCLDLVLASERLRSARDWALDTELLPPSLWDRAAPLGVRVVAARPPGALPAFSPVDPGPGDPLLAAPPALGELHSLFLDALRGDQDPVTWDRLLLGVTSVPGTPDAALSSLSVADRWLDARSTGRDLAAMLYRWWVGEPVKVPPGAPRHLADLWSARAHELMEHGPSGTPVVLLAPATCTHGTVSVEALSARLDRLESAALTPLRWDAQQLLLRLDPSAFDDATLVDRLAAQGIRGRPGADLEVDVRRVAREGKPPSYGVVARADTSEPIDGPEGWVLLRRPPKATEKLGYRPHTHPSPQLRTTAPWHPRLVAAHLAPVVAARPEWSAVAGQADYVLGATGLLGTRNGALAVALGLGVAEGDRRAAAVDVLLDGLSTGTADPEFLAAQLQRVAAAGDLSAARLTSTLGPLLTDSTVGPALCALVRGTLVAFAVGGDRKLGGLVTALIDGCVLAGGPPLTEPELVAIADARVSSLTSTAMRRLREVLGPTEGSP